MRDRLSPHDLSDLDYDEELAERSLVPDPARLAAGTRLGRYELLAPVAAGGMATVWAARLVGHRGFSKLVAVKAILPHLAEDAMFEGMFLEEARIASRIDHPNVCAIYEFGEERGLLYLVMEWMGGDSLAQILGKGAGTPIVPIDVRVAARIAADACAGLAAAHDHVDLDGAHATIVHRDISPHNVLVSDNGVVKLTDFGVAKALNQSQATAAGVLKGKLAYMAPEYIESSRVDARSDVYSMGVVLYEATVGRLPFTGDRDALMMEGIIRGKPPRPREIVPSYPRELEAIVLRAMARDPNGRFASAEDLKLALEEWLARSGAPVMQSGIARLVMGRLRPRIESRRADLREIMRMQDERASMPPAPAVSGSYALAPPAGEGTEIVDDRDVLDVLEDDDGEAVEHTVAMFPPGTYGPPSAPLPAYGAPPFDRGTPDAHAHANAMGYLPNQPGAPLFSSMPPAPVTLEQGPTAIRTRPAPARPKTPFILAGVALVMCATLGIVGRQASKRRDASAAASLAATTPLATPPPEAKPVAPPPPVAPTVDPAAPNALELADTAADPTAADAGPSTNASNAPNAGAAIPVMPASGLPNAPSDAPAPDLRRRVESAPLPPNPY